MDTLNLSAYFSLGLGLGMIHAFDPDHMAAVGAISAADKGKKIRYWSYALRWSLGHASALALIAAAVLLLGMAVPVYLSEVAERSVAYMLMGFGVFALYRVLKPASINAPASSAIGRRGAPLVGLIHGVAGSAPLLALIPLSQVTSPWVGFVYVVCFSAGVSLAMVALASLFSFSLSICVAKRDNWRLISQISLANFSILVGFYLLFFP